MTPEERPAGGAVTPPLNAERGRGPCPSPRGALVSRERRQPIVSPPALGWVAGESGVNVPRGRGRLKRGRGRAMTEQENALELPDAPGRISEPAGVTSTTPALTTTQPWLEGHVMAEIQPTADRPFFKPLPEHDTLNAAYFLFRVSEQVEVNEFGCWAWIGNKVGVGYGRISCGGRNQLVHRLIYSLCVGPLRGRIEVCHDCPGGDNPSCVNPSHLFLGTHTDNMRDAKRKGRLRPSGLRGQSHGSAKLTDDDVREIRRRVGNGERGSVVAREKGVSQAAVSEIVSRKKWGHLE